MNPHAGRHAILSRTPRVSVVMAAYDAQPYLAEAIESVLGQTLGDFELLLVDDASTDGTPAIIERYARLDHRVRSIRLPSNEGTAHAKNVALDHARAPLVAICDDDDRQHPMRLASQAMFLEENPEHVMVGCGIRPFGNPDGTSLGWLPSEGALARPHILFQAIGLDSANMFRRELASVHGLRYPVGLLWDDWVFQAQALRIGGIHVLPQTLLDYRRHAAQQTSSERLMASGRRTRATMERVLQVAGVQCGRAELELHHAISPNPFGLVTDRSYLLQHHDTLEDEASAWIGRLGRRAVQAGWTSETDFADMAAEVLLGLPQLLRAAQAGASLSYK